MFDRALKAASYTEVSIGVGMEEEMIRKNYIALQRLIASLTVFALFAMPIAAVAQTQIQLHSNKYKVTDDVKVGRQAAAEVEKQFPILNDREATNYVSRVGSASRVQYHNSFSILNLTTISRL